MNTNKKKKKGLWAIMSQVMFEIRISMILAAVGAVSLITSLVIISFALSAVMEDKPIVFFNHELDILNTVLLIAVFTVVAFLSRLFAFSASHLGAFRLEQILRSDLSSHLAKVPLGYIITTGSGALKKVMLDDVKNLHVFVADSVPMIAKSIVAPIVSLIVLIVIDYRLALIAVLVLVVGAVIMSIAMRDSAELRKKYETSQSEINKAVVEFVQAMPVVRTFGDGSDSFERYNNSLISYRDNLQAWVKKSGTSARMGMLVLGPLPTLLAVLGLSLILLDNKTLEMSALIAALFLSTGMADSLMPVMWLTNFIKKSQTSAFRIQEVLDIDRLEETDSPKIPNDASISFDNVCFRYKKNHKYALNNLSFRVPSKSVTALVGPSGAGKSTVAKLIPRFWDIDSGSIKIGDTDIKEISSHVLMNTVSYVFQDTFLFHDTILNNIKMANPKATDEEVIDAAKTAQIHDFIVSLPDGYQTLAGDRGANLSGGQKQRVTIARAVLRDAPIIILDEATAFTDPQNEEEIIKALANLIVDKTVIVIAHRLSTIKGVDQIIVFDDGKIVQSGKHDELIEKKGVYYELWQNYEKAQGWNLENKEEQI